MSGLSADDEVEFCWLLLAAVLLIQATVLLAGYWSVPLKARLTARRLVCNAESLAWADSVLALPTKLRGKAQILDLRKSENRQGLDATFVVFQQQVYRFGELDGAGRFGFGRPELPIGKPREFYAAARGLESPESLAAAHEMYGGNSFDVPSRTFKDMYIEHALAPFFVFQIMCVLLWLLDEYWHYALLTLVMLLFLEGVMVKQRLRNLAALGSMSPEPSKVNVLREGTWSSVWSTTLVPGDIIALAGPRGRNEADPGAVPCDVVLLYGKVIVNEAMLTGESVPQAKEPLLEGGDAWPADRTLSLESDKLHIVFGGTTVVQHSEPTSAVPFRSFRSGAALGMVVRTGFDTAQGSLVRTIVFAAQRMTAANAEALGFICFLLAFALLAAWHVWTTGIERAILPKSKLLLECILIVTSVVPPELPMELSMAVNSSLVALQSKGVFCTEPFRIPYGGKVDVCCFDKTGTLTTEELVVRGVAGVDANNPDRLVRASSAPPAAGLVLGACHSLVAMRAEVVGDPMERAALHASRWHLTSTGAEIGRGGMKTSAFHVRVFHFSSSLKRMSVIAKIQHGGMGAKTPMVLTKGAPEVIANCVADLPHWYWSAYSGWARKGARVIALATRTLTEAEAAKPSAVPRDVAESNLEFAGFLVMNCPLKVDSLASIDELHESSHRTMMITGDALLTGISVAEKLGMATRQVLTLLADPVSGMPTEWIDPELSILLSTSSASARRVASELSLTRLPVAAYTPATVGELVSSYDVALDGPGFAALADHDPALLDALLPYVRVFARVTPQQKELVLATLRRLGLTTLMCGDGTNDVGALKQAHVGVALLNVDNGASLRAKIRADAGLPVEHAAGDDDDDDESEAAASSTGARKAAELRKRKAERAGLSAKELAAARRKARAKGKGKKNRSGGAAPQGSLAAAMSSEPVIKLGDASIASPFTSKSSSIHAICLVIQQGRCTLVTTHQMYRILALNCLVNAYALSVLYLDGVKFGDLQMTLMGILVAVCFLFISRSKPLPTLSAARPQPRVFTAYLLVSLLGQFAVHLGALMYLVAAAKDAIGLGPNEVVSADLEADFEPNVVNNVVFILSAWMQTANFAINYRGHPFMEGLRENKILIYILATMASLLILLALGVIPPLAYLAELAPWPSFSFQLLVVATLVADAIGALAMEHIASVLFNRAEPRLPVQ
ncbi:endoplasmic reticulum Ca-transporting P-type ATPase [Thecamonas trahens ATCC 50062]|uniref:Endoplasmic reticulum Ca-transporting P-type ATPase n=1 Tax=Thecamonas trahens ATCC 50062 TaxID=461836 RepID=A0A0L0D5Q0_THETB|nr:endoplasmic reticulum Ca-transporting P-type ATPase [Thecamonas trahens ATCC 50062]KNC47416.1 endoplasmic reticulum Ca-transporting P-type ATPase [Thecamonas trahens ATCC 50062]|eukprot:XP_013759752.1 endoplasmic reticulum Ca-transporting P-type ATPase [Thecamonas trahens ATCC 50062]